MGYIKSTPSTTKTTRGLSLREWADKMLSFFHILWKLIARYGSTCRKLSMQTSKNAKVSFLNNSRLVLCLRSLIMLLLYHDIFFYPPHRFHVNKTKHWSVLAQTWDLSEISQWKLGALERRRALWKMYKRRIRLSLSFSLSYRKWWWCHWRWNWNCNFLLEAHFTLKIILQ